MKTVRNGLACVLLVACGQALAIDRDEARMELAQAATAVQAAERDDAMRYAPREVDEAHATLALAQQAADSRDWNDAALYAERAKVNGDLASARSRQQRAEAAAAELQRSVDAFRIDDGGAP